MFKFPVFVKPDKGQGSQNAEIINNKESLKNALRDNCYIIVLEYLIGKEYTVDCFNHRKDGLLFVEEENEYAREMGFL